MRSERYFLPPLELTDDELAALQTCLYLLEGKFAYAEPLRLALQNLALGRPGFSEAPTDTAMRVEVLDPEYSTEMQGRLSKLEAAISKQRTVKFPYWSISRDEERERTVNPYALFQDAGAWYVVGHDLEAEDERTFRVSRIRGDIRFATRRSATSGYRRISTSTSTAAARLADRRPRRRGAHRGRRRHGLVGAAHVRRQRPGRGRRLRHRVPTCACSRRGCCARTAGRAAGAGRAPARGRLALRRVRDLHEKQPRGPPPRHADEDEESSSGRPPGRAPSASPSSRRCSPTSSAACGESRRRRSRPPSSSSASSRPRSSRSTSRSSTSSTSAAAATRSTPSSEGDTVRVDKELSATRSAPAAPDAARGAGDQARARVRRPDDRRRRPHSARARRLKLEETFGEFELAQTPEPHSTRRGGADRDAHRGRRDGGSCSSNT